MVVLVFFSGRSNRFTLCSFDQGRTVNSFTSIHLRDPELLQVRFHNVDKLFGAPGAGASFTIRIDDMLPDMVFNDLSHQAVHGTARGDYQMKDLGAAFFFLDGTL